MFRILIALAALTSWAIAAVTLEVMARDTMDGNASAVKLYRIQVQAPNGTAKGLRTAQTIDLGRLSLTFFVLAQAEPSPATFQSAQLVQSINLLTIKARVYSYRIDKQTGILFRSSVPAGPGRYIHCNQTILSQLTAQDITDAISICKSAKVLGPV